MHEEEKKEPIRELIEKCVGCGECSDNCILLQEIDADPAAIASRGAAVDEAFACSLCRMCEAVCPLDLSPARMFEQKRTEAVANAEIDINEYRYLFPDRPVNVMSLFRKVYGVDYADLNPNVTGPTAFFPGCTMMTYSPGLTRKVYTSLSKSYPNLQFLMDCCGKPLYQLGLLQRGEKNREELKGKIKQLGIKRLIVACPNCYYELTEALVDEEVELITVYEGLKEAFIAGENYARCTVHDSCPDRFKGIFGQQVRQALKGTGCQIVDMEHSQQTTPCCGSGGQVSHFRPDFAEELVERRLKEAEATGADTLVAYCHSCVLNFAKIPSGIKVRHALNLLLGFEQDYAGVKSQAREMFAGPDGEENWQKIMEASGEG